MPTEDDPDEFAASVERDLAQLPTTSERDRDCIAPLKRRTTSSIQSAVARPVTRKLSARPLNPISSTGRRP